MVLRCILVRSDYLLDLGFGISRFLLHDAAFETPRMEQVISVENEPLLSKIRGILIRIGYGLADLGRGLPLYKSDKENREVGKGFGGAVLGAVRGVYSVHSIRSVTRCSTQCEERASFVTRCSARRGKCSA